MTGRRSAVSRGATLRSSSAAKRASPSLQARRGGHRAVDRGDPEVSAQGKPALILMDELLNYLNRERNRKRAWAASSIPSSKTCQRRRRAQIGRARVSLPSVVDRDDAEDEADFQRFEKPFGPPRQGNDHVGRSRRRRRSSRRLFEWAAARRREKDCGEYADWVQAHRTRSQTGSPSTREGHVRRHLSVPPVPAVRIEQSGQALPRFQQTRGVMRLLALWVANAYQADSRRSQGSAHRHRELHHSTIHCSDRHLRAARGAKLEGAVTTTFAARRTHMRSASTKRRWRRYARRASSESRKLPSSSNRTADRRSRGGHSRRFVSRSPNPES